MGNPNLTQGFPAGESAQPREVKVRAHYLRWDEGSQWLSMEPPATPRGGSRSYLRKKKCRQALGREEAWESRVPCGSGRTRRQCERRCWTCMPTRAPLTIPGCWQLNEWKWKKVKDSVSRFSGCRQDTDTEHLHPQVFRWAGKEEGATPGQHCGLGSEATLMLHIWHLDPSLPIPEPVFFPLSLPVCLWWRKSNWINGQAQGILD